MRHIVIERTTARPNDWFVMMMTTTRMLHARASATAIAAALALSSTTAIAQEAQPAPTAATPATTSEPAPTTAAPADSTPSATDTTATAAPAAKTTKARTAARTATRAATKATHAATAATHAATRASASHSAAPTAAAAAPGSAAATPVAKPPVVDMAAQPAAPQPATAKPAPANNEAALELGGGALAILALGTGAFALARRRRHAREEVWEDETAMTEEPTAEPAMPRLHDPVAEYEPPVVAPVEQSAFGWNRAEDSGGRPNDERRDGETWVERAYRGPTADNPSQSLRKRLKRAAFFDKREREIAANRAAPVEPDAGLPERAMEERELEAA